MPAAFRRLCVETLRLETIEQAACIQPPLGGCVLKPCRDERHTFSGPSRL